MITGKTRLLAVIGAPIAHSLSPIIQNAALHAAGLDYVYAALPVRADALASAVRGLYDAGIAGFNVTIPFKTAIIPLMDALSEDARRIQAVNTVVVEDGRLVGHNTDVAGFLVAIGVRCVEKGAALAADFVANGAVQACAFDDPAFARALATADIVVQTTPLGMTPHTDAMPPVDMAALKDDAVLYDLIYTPAETCFLREARARGCETINGETMLAAQGAEAFHLWTGKRPDVELMKRVLREELARNTLRY